jgi:DNA transformation protein and related proteins
VAVSGDFTIYVIEQLRGLPNVTSRRMFGGVGLYSDGFFFALLADDTLYLKADDRNRADFERHGCQPFRPFADRPHWSMSYYDVPAEVLDDAEELGRWARKSLAAGIAAARPKPKTKSAKSDRQRKATARAKRRK